MTHWIRGVLGRVMNRLAQRVQTTERGGPSRKVKGVSTVEYALILVAVVAIVGGGVSVLTGDFQKLFDLVGTEIDEGKTAVDGVSVS